MLTAGPTQHVPTEKWQFTVTTETGQRHTWDWAAADGAAAGGRDGRHPLRDAVVEARHPVAGSVRGHAARGCRHRANFALVGSYGGYTTNLPLDDLLEGQAWVAYRFDDEDLGAEHGGPARLLVPHLYLWKSAKWVNSITLSDAEELGFWESAGYHNYGDPWREQRYWE